MVPLAVLVTATLAARGLGLAGVDAVDSWRDATRVGLSMMLLLTASAHFGRRRADLVRMVPPALPRPGLLVTLTGVAEIAIAVSLLVPQLAAGAAVALVVLLVAMFPANVHAARERLTIGGRPATPLALRTVVQAVFVAAAAAVAVAAA